MTAVQARFRRLLAHYPADWQAEHGEAYLGVMLDVADAEGRAGPTAQERVSVLRHAATVWRQELGRRGAGDPAVASLRWVGPAGLVGGSVLAVLFLVLGEGVELTSDLPQPTWMLVLGPLWLVALAAALAGRERASRALLITLALGPLPALLVAVSQLGGAIDANGATIHLFPGVARFVDALVGDRWVALLSDSQPPIIVVGMSLACAAAAAAAGPPRSHRGRRATAGAVAVGSFLTVGFGVVSQQWAGPFGQASLAHGGLERMLEPLVLLTVLATAVGLVLLRRRPGFLVAVAVVGWPWAVAAVLVHSTVFQGPHLFPWSLEALFLMVAPIPITVALAGTVVLHRLRRPAGVTA